MMHVCFSNYLSAQEPRGRIEHLRVYCKEGEVNDFFGCPDRDFIWQLCQFP